MKFNYGFEYSEKDYENLSKTTTSVFGGIGSLLSKGLDTFKELEILKLQQDHEINVKRSENEILKKESELEELKTKQKETEWELRKLKIKSSNQQNVSIFEDDE